MTRINQHGFTLLELLMTLAIAAVLLSLAVPAYKQLVSRNRLAALVSDLVGDLNYARNEAINRGQPVFVCASEGQLPCSNDGNWRHGWVVYMQHGDTDTASRARQILRARQVATDEISLISNVTQPVRFNAGGFAIFGRSFTVDNAHGRQEIQITIASTGRVRARRKP